jgi:hypothetical protein
MISNTEAEAKQIIAGNDPIHCIIAYLQVQRTIDCRQLQSRLVTVQIL